MILDHLLSQSADCFLFPLQDRSFQWSRLSPLCGARWLIDGGMHPLLSFFLLFLSLLFPSFLRMARQDGAVFLFFVT